VVGLVGVLLGLRALWSRRERRAAESAQDAKTGDAKTGDAKTEDAKTEDAKTEDPNDRPCR
jgi:hypothetical protein